MQFLWKYIDVLAGKGLSAGIIAELLLYTSASLVPMALPLAILLAALMTFGNLGENYELTAIKSAGISLQRIMAPLTFLVAAISLLAFFFSNNVMPYSNLKMRSLIYDITQKRPSFQITEGVFYDGIEGYSIKIGRRDSRTNILYDIKIYDHTEGKGNVSVTIADSGFMKMTSDSNLIFTLYHGYSYNELAHDRRVRNRNTYPHRRDKFEKQDVVFSMTGFNFSRTDETLFKTGYQMMNLDQLAKNKDSLLIEFDKGRRMFYRDMVTTNYFRTDLKVRRKNIGDTNIIKLPDSRFRVFNPDTAFLSLDLLSRQSIVSTSLNLARSAKSYVSSQKESFAGKVERMRRHEIEWHRKFTLSIACLIFFFIGAPLGAIIRKGGLGMPVVVSVLFFVFWYVISLTGEKFAREDIIQAYAGMWLSSFILLPVGIFLTYKATTDSAILNLDTYSRFFKKIGVFLKVNNLFTDK
jgi:lipopolysaccharide export system permease protein